MKLTKSRFRNGKDTCAVDALSGEAISHLNLSKRIREILREKIVNWQIPMGTKLSEESVAQELGVSRTPVREALGALREAGLVEHIPRKGMQVIRLGKSDVDEIYDIRMALEGVAAYRAAMHISEEELAEMSMDLELSEPDFQKGSLRAFVDIDTRFHDRIIANCGSQRLRAQLGKVQDLVLMFRLWDGALEPPLNTATKVQCVTTLREHWGILDAMTKRDQELAKELLCQHIAGTKKWLIENYAFDVLADDEEVLRLSTAGRASQKNAEGIQ